MVHSPIVYILIWFVHVWCRLINEVPSCQIVIAVRRCCVAVNYWCYDLWPPFKHGRHRHRIHGEIGVAAVRFVKDTPARHQIHTRDVFHRKCRNLLDTKRVREKIGTSSLIHDGMDYLSFKDYAWNQVKLSTFLQSAFW